eukprot:CAMPEP_0197535612 /NCGR_PEP_ID=MMETSP1318-20131121/51166_1 /TAXON_ID=552666 /ORGANISM="Partenskyella glossopodia, Strain RCC365" /LENGTH=44 /DNA_ID= /DNA_START= /DNA_END= /DNA_ORIENTATION=
MSSSWHPRDWVEVVSGAVSHKYELGLMEGQHRKYDTEKQAYGDC